VTGLTTAATLWVVAGIGMAAGAGAFIDATGATLLVLVILWPLGWVEDRIEAQRRGRTLRVIFTEMPGITDTIQKMFEDAGLMVKLESVTKARENEQEATFEIRGSSNQFRRVRADVVEMPEVKAVFRV
jgi:putative Mg2+ transporter-C (MgtC) family protein